MLKCPLCIDFIVLHLSQTESFTLYDKLLYDIFKLNKEQNNHKQFQYLVCESVSNYDSLSCGVSSIFYF